ncbi:hypothetical protein PR202_gb23652 [Eleusine coracana subsp. coracana]|uniref:Uncharacterized protein n=1 Tax=Eleusine coracana subsp. coracana TaxID=191504 RepID=A0AAV5FJB9_ELECO|nr:hypothetical protein PR202_gb23652 [Eleusine coracana subsp. coracana]
MLNFEQRKKETLAQAWLCFQSLLKEGPDLGMDNNLFAQAFCMSLEGPSRLYLDRSARGSFLNLTAKPGMHL